MRIGETLFWFLRYLVLISIFPTQFPFTIVELKFWLIHTTVSALSCAGKKILRKFSCSVRVCHNWEGLVTCWRFGSGFAEMLIDIMACITIFYFVVLSCRTVTLQLRTACLFRRVDLFRHEVRTLHSDRNIIPCDNRR